jgi:hypothetical protein
MHTTGGAVPSGVAWDLAFVHVVMNSSAYNVPTIPQADSLNVSCKDCVDRGAKFSALLAFILYVRGRGAGGAFRMSD